VAHQCLQNLEEQLQISLPEETCREIKDARVWSRLPSYESRLVYRYYVQARQQLFVLLPLVPEGSMAPLGTSLFPLS
jgi:hypothetical protein